MAPNPLLATRCANCGVEVQRGLTRVPRRVCQSCQAIRRQATRAGRGQGRTDGRASGFWKDATFLTTESAQRRQAADQHLDKHGGIRHCACGRKYRLLTFDTPCPSCGDHLIPLPGVA